MPKISVLVPVYNVEKYIRRCLTSIQEQSLQDIEIIVVNDATPDNSMAIVRELARSDDRIKILEHEKNMGLMWTRRTGYLAATGDYITFCDSDDYLPVDALASLYSAAIETGADIVSGNFIYVTTSNEETFKFNKLPYGNTPTGVYKALLRHDLQHNLCGKLFKGLLLRGYDYRTFEHATNGEDGCLLYQVVQHCNKIIQIDDAVYYYMQNIGSSTQKRLNENAIRSICLLNRIRVDILLVFPELKDDLYRCVVNVLCNLYAGGYHLDARLSENIHDCGLEDYVSLSKIVEYLDYMKFMKTYLLRIIKPYNSR